MVRMFALALFLLLYSTSANPPEIDFTVTQQEREDYARMDGPHRYAWLQSVAIRGCPVPIPKTMSEEDAISRLGGYAPIDAVLTFMQGDCEDALAAIVAAAPTAVQTGTKGR